MKPVVRELYAAMLQRELDEVRELSAAWIAKRSIASCSMPFPVSPRLHSTHRSTGNTP